MDQGIPMKVEIQSDSSTSNSLTDRLGAGPRTKHIDTRNFQVQERAQYQVGSDHGSPLHPLQDDGHLLNRADVGGAEQETESANCQSWF